MGVLAAILPNTARMERVRAAVRDRHTLVECATWGELVAACDEYPIHIAILDIYSLGPTSFEPVRQLKRRFPHIALLAYVDLQPDRVRDIFDAGRYGFDALAVANADDSPTQLLAHIERAGARGVGTLVKATLGKVDPVARDAMMVAVTRAHERLTPAMFARILGMGVKQLGRRLAESAYPPPQRLLTWGRLIVVSQRLTDTERSADQLAKSHGFTSGSAFRNTCQRYLGMRPQQIRANGGARLVLEILLREVEARRKTHSAPARHKSPRRK